MSVTDTNPMQRPLAITTGSGRRNPQGTLVGVDAGLPPVPAVQKALADIPMAECAWWSPHQWSQDYARSSDWVGAHCLALDLDFEDPRLGRQRHTTPEHDAWAGLSMLGQDGDLPASLLHSTPRGARVVFVFTRMVTNRLEMHLALRGAAKLVREALTSADLHVVDPPGGGRVREGFRVDSAPLNLKSIFWAPKCTVGGVHRASPVQEVRREPWDPAELAAIPDEVETAGVRRLLGLDRGCQPWDLPAGGGDYAEAVAKWCEDHPVTWPARVESCPACGHNGCFKALPDDPSRWFCFSTNHELDSGGVGQPSPAQPGAYWGDALDIAAHKQGCAPVDLLREGGYLGGGVSEGLRESIDRILERHTKTREERPGGDAEPGDAGKHEDRGPKPLRYQVLGLREVMEMEPPPPLVGGLLREQDIAVLYGAPGTGKSFVAIALAMAIATGTPWVGREVMGPSPVLVICGEGAYGVGKRIRAWYGGEEPPEDCPAMSNWHQINDLVPMLVDRSFRDLTEAIGAMSEMPRLVVIDTLAHAMVGGDENAAKDMGTFIDRAQRLRDMTGAAVLLVHHTRKEETGTERGHSALRGAADLMMSLQSQGTGCVELSITKAKDEDAGEPISIDLELVEMGTDSRGDPVSSLRAVAGSGAMPDVEVAANCSAILAVMEQAPEGWSWGIQETMDGAKLTRTQVREAWKRLAETGRIILTYHGANPKAILRADAMED